MLPSGSNTPTILFLGDAPPQADDSAGKHFQGKTGNFLRAKIPQEFRNKIRYSHAINCKASEIDHIALQACRPRFEQDVLKTKPKAIFGFGYHAITQVLKPDSKYSSVALLRGRRFPVNIEGHHCWFYPMLHPYENVLKKRKYEPKGDAYGSDDEFAFVLDLKNAFAEIESLPDPVIHTIEQATANIEIVNDINRIADLLSIVADDPSVGVDIETNCLRPYSEGAKILSIAFSGKQHTFSFVLDHSQANWTKLERKQLDVLIKSFLYEAKCRKVSHNLPFEQEWLAAFYGTGCLYAGRWEDSLSQGYLLDARRGALSLDFLCIQYFGLNLKAISGLDRKNLDKAPLNQVLKYNAIDARYHRQLYLVQQKRIKQQGLQGVYEEQLRRIPALVLATMQGVPVDQTVVKKLKNKYAARVVAAEQAIAKDESVLAFEEKKGRKFNPGSHIDVNILLKDILGIDLKTTAKGELAHVNHPIAKLIVQFREPSKVISTYIDSIAEDSETTNLFPDKALHPIISSTTVVTWRTSSDSPNIQNFPKRDGELKEVREQVKSADPDIVVVSIDYAGIQARNVAMESLDKKLIEAFWKGYDIHSVWREKIVKKYPKWIPKSDLKDKDAMKAFRHLAKNKFVFPTFFGAQAYNTSEGLGVPKNICEDLREEFFDEFPDIEKWHKGLEKFYYTNGYVTGLSGFRRRAPVSVNELINTPIQSDESIIVMNAMQRLSEMEDPRYQAALMIHDDLTFFMPRKEVEKRLEVIVKEMINVPFEWTNVVPIEVEVSMGPDWINMEKIGEYRNDKWNGVVEIKTASV